MLLQKSRKIGPKWPQFEKVGRLGPVSVSVVALTCVGWKKYTQEITLGSVHNQIHKKNQRYKSFQNFHSVNRNILVGTPPHFHQKGLTGVSILVWK